MASAATLAHFPEQPKKHVSAFAYAVVAECIILVALILISRLDWWKKESPLKEVMTLDLTSVPPQPKPPEPPKVQPPVPHHMTPVPRLVTPPTVQPAAPLVEKSTEPTPFVEKPPLQSPPQPSPNLDKSAAEIATYAGQIRAAVQSALIYPQAALAMSYSGRARVEFSLKDQQASAARILISSKIGLFDRAALAAVISASYPAPPAALAGQQKTYQVWVEFNR